VGKGKREKTTLEEKKRGGKKSKGTMGWRSSSEAWIFLTVRLVTLDRNRMEREKKGRLKGEEKEEGRQERRAPKALLFQRPPTLSFHSRDSRKTGAG